MDSKHHDVALAHHKHRIGKAEVIQNGASDEEISPAEGRKIVHKVDRRLIPALGLMFAVSLMDRTNLGNANIAGMGKDLELTKGFRYV